MSNSFSKKTKASSRLTIVTNQFCVNLPEALKVFIYSLSFLPSIPSDNSKLKKLIVNKSRSELSRHLEGFIYCGENIYSTKGLFTEIKEADETSSSERPEFFKFLADHEGICYEGSLVPCGCLAFSGDTIRDERALQVVNISLRNKLKVLKFIQFGSFRNHYNSSDAKPVRGFPAEIWPGFFTSINKLKGGLMLTIDSSYKLLRTDSVLEVISDLMHRHKNFEHKVKAELKNSIVMTFYGSQNVYRIVDILFDENPLSAFPDQSKAKNYLQYFEKFYQARIRNKNQPLILARRSLKDSAVRLVPELCRMTGPESLGNSLKLKKAVSDITRLNPTQKLEKIRSLAEMLNQVQDPKWQMINSSNPVTVNAKQLSYPHIRTSDNESLQVNEKSVFNLKKFIPIKSQPCNRWQLFCFESLKSLAEEFIRGLKSVSSSMSQDLQDPLKISIPNNLDQSSLSSFLLSKLKAGAQLVVLLIPKNSSVYASIKSVLTKDFPVASQVVTDVTIQKNDPSVYSKIFTQILCKIGGIPWTVPLPSLPRYTMIVGIDVCHNSFTSRQSVLGFWASLNSSFTIGYSKSAFHGVNQEISDVLTPIFNESIKKFLEVNSGHKPECIIVYRDGVGKSQYEKVANIEIPQVVAAIQDIDRQWKPQIVVLGVNKRVNQRFFLDGRNPGHGLVIDEGVVLDSSNFYLISHFSGIGCVTPTHYHVVVNDSQISEHTLYQLTYHLCYLYFNWQGGIRVPAPCMYAHKIAYLVGKHTGVLFDESLSSSFFFL